MDMALSKTFGFQACGDIYCFAFHSPAPIFSSPIKMQQYFRGVDLKSRVSVIGPRTSLFPLPVTGSGMGKQLGLAKELGGNVCWGYYLSLLYQWRMKPILRPQAAPASGWSLPQGGQREDNQRLSLVTLLILPDSQSLTKHIPSVRVTEKGTHEAKRGK